MDCFELSAQYSTISTLKTSSTFCLSYSKTNNLQVALSQLRLALSSPLPYSLFEPWPFLARRPLLSIWPEKVSKKEYRGTPQPAQGLCPHDPFL